MMCDLLCLKMMVVAYLRNTCTINCVCGEEMNLNVHSYLHLEITLFKRRSYYGEK